MSKSNGMCAVDERRSNRYLLHLLRLCLLLLLRRCSLHVLLRELCGLRHQLLHHVLLRRVRRQMRDHRLQLLQLLLLQIDE